MKRKLMRFEFECEYCGNKATAECPEDKVTQYTPCPPDWRIIGDTCGFKRATEHICPDCIKRKEL